MIGADDQYKSENPSPLRYFSRNKLVFLIRRPGGGVNDDDGDRDAELRENLLNNDVVRQVDGLPDVLGEANLTRRLTLGPDGRDGALELVSFEGTIPDTQLIRFVEAVTEIVDPPSRQSDSQIDVVDWLGGVIDAQPSEGALQVVGLAPDWFFGGAGQADPDQGGTGGPGGRPVPVTFPENAWWETQDVLTPEMPFGFDLPAVLAPILGEFFSRGDGVDVAILDTAPTVCDLQRAYGLWQEEHPLLRGLLGPMGSFGIDPANNPHFNVTYAPDRIMLPLNHPRRGVGLRSVGYTMPDHGLFSAGIVHSLAPGAHLRLIQVLNDFGVGTLESITWGLRQLARSGGEARLPLVVNLSLTMNMPRDMAKHESKNLDWTRLDEAKFNKNMARLFEAILRVMLDRDALVVAAAGNDRRSEMGQDRPIARYPAAFQWVVGVGALNKTITRNADGVFRVTPSNYTNIADDPGANGFLIYGGDMVASGQADAENGILGTYVTEFPNGKLCENGWARWCGTSFAAPIISGLLAMLLSRGETDPVRVLRESVIEKVTALKAEDQEQIMLVYQGMRLPLP